MKTELLTILHHNRELVGDFYFPDNDTPSPLVIFSHGYNGSGKDFILNAHLLSEHNIAAFCYDFCGGSVNARSSMETSNMTIFTEMEDLCAVLDFLKKDPMIDENNIFLFGASQGGFISALVAEQRTEDIQGLLLLYPALCIPDDWNNRFPDISDIPDSLELWGMKLGHDFFVALHGFKTSDHIGNYPREVLVMHGSEDKVVAKAYVDKLPSIYPHAVLELFPGEGHGFTKAGNQRVAQMTLDFIEKYKK